MARLFLIGNKNIKFRSPEVIEEHKEFKQTEQLTLIYVDDIQQQQKITPFYIKINIRQLNQFSVDHLIKQQIQEFLKVRDLQKKQLYFYDIYGNSIKYYSKSIKFYLFSIRSNLFWLFARPYDNFLKQINDLERGYPQSQHKIKKIPNINVGKLKSCLSSVSLKQEIPISQHSHRSTFLNKQMKNLQNVYDNYANSTTRATSVHSSRININLFCQQKQQKKRFNDKEQYFLDNLQQCNEELEQYINSLHSQLSTYKDDIDKIVNFYDQIQYPTPKSRAYEIRNISNIVSDKLQNILEKDQISQRKNRDYFSEQQNWLESIPSLAQLNIPQLQTKNSLSREQLYSFYSLYKVLQLISMIQSKYLKNKLSFGISYDIYRNDIENIQEQSEFMARGIFSIIDKRCSGFLDWQQFLFLMSSVQAKTKEERIDLFIKIADSDGNGKLSFPEALILSESTMSKIIKTADKKFLEDIANFFTRLIFDSVNVSYEKEIDFYDLKDIITKGHPNSDLLCLFCGAEAYQ